MPAWSGGGRAVLVSLLVLGAAARPHGQTDALENKLKAAFVSKFPQFVEWPMAALDAQPTVNVCVGVPDPFGTDLDELVAGIRLNGRTFVVRRLTPEQSLDGCHLLYLPQRVTGGHRSYLQRAVMHPILTVSDDPRFLDDGGIVRLRVINGRVRFDVSVIAAQKAGLRISSQLLQLAASVRGGP